MAFKLFGFEIKRKGEQYVPVASVITPSNEDGSTVVSSVGSFYGITLDAMGGVKNENDLIRRYRSAAQYADVDAAIEDIIDEAIVSENSGISLELSGLDMSESIKKHILKEFENVLDLLDFRNRGHDIFRNWYVDGRLYYNVIVDVEKPEDGILELRYIDPRKIRKIKDIEKLPGEGGVIINKVIDEYYMYNDMGIDEAGSAVNGVKLSLDSVVYCNSGLIDGSTGSVISNLHKALKRVNQLQMMEDAIVIYRISRAADRRVFNIDVGNMPRDKAEAYVGQIAAKYRNKTVYDASTGEVQNDRQHLSMVEDFWIPKREGGKGTDIATLNGASNLGEIQDVQYFQRKLYQSLNVPISRLEPTDGFSLGRTTEITRDEVKFSKFIDRLRRRFNTLFFDLLRVQLICREVIREDEWDMVKKGIEIRYDEDNHFAELKDSEIISQRINSLGSISPYVGTYYSKEWVVKNVLHMTEEEIDEIDEQNKVAAAATKAAESAAQANETSPEEIIPQTTKPKLSIA